MDFITGQGGGAQTNSKVRNLASSLITVLFSLYFHRQVYFISQRVAVVNPYAQINLPIGKGKTDRKNRCEQLQPEESGYMLLLQHNGNFTKARAAVA